jgi:hypothetical protein
MRGITPEKLGSAIIVVTIIMKIVRFGLILQKRGRRLQNVIANVIAALATANV